MLDIGGFKKKSPRHVRCEIVDKYVGFLGDPIVMPAFQKAAKHGKKCEDRMNGFNKTVN